LEDFAALVGLVVAFVLAIEVKSLLVGVAATPESVGKIRGAIESTEGVDRLIHLKTLHVAPEELLVAAKIAVAAAATGESIARTIDAAERNLREAEPMAVQVFLEPDIFRRDYEPDPRPEPPAAASH
jgi:divalent metal cation (Fe/Co/Zn/Cd) transporter